MKALFNRAALLKAIKCVAPVVPIRSPKPVLLSVKLSVEDDQTFLEATDLEISIKQQVHEVDVMKTGSCLLPFGRFSAILSESSDVVINVETTDEGHIVVTGERSRFKMPSEDVKEYPTTISDVAKPTCTIASSVLKRMLSRTVFAADVASTRYALNGVLFEVAGKQLKLVASDGRRLVVSTGQAKKHADPLGEGAHVVPIKACEVIGRALPDDETEIQIVLDAAKATFVSPDSTILARLLEGRFPRYNEVMPNKDSANLTIELPIQMLMQSTRQAALVTNEESRGVDWSIGHGRLTMRAKAAEVGTSECEMPVSYTGKLADQLDGSDNKTVEITFDPRYLVDALKTLPVESSVTCRLIDHAAAAIFEAENWVYCVMPLTRDK
jgi:DNA polymerase-3 subunit beta